MDEGMDKKDFGEFCGIIDTLLGENGCPWDKEQTHQSLVPHFLNEAQELVEAIEKNDSENLCEELGDILLHVVIMAKIAEKDGIFSLDDVIDGISQKMIRRHPHVFGNVEGIDIDNVMVQWEEIKRLEKAKNIKNAK